MAVKEYTINKEIRGRAALKAINVKLAPGRMIRLSVEEDLFICNYDGVLALEPSTYKGKVESRIINSNAETNKGVGVFIITRSFTVA